MPIAALPDYLGKNELSTASPGLRFGMYLPLWGKDNRTGELLWRSHDKNKTASLKQAVKLNPGDIDAMTALTARQSALAVRVAASGQMLIVDGLSVAPFTTGLGNEHPLENGFAFLNPYGLPYLPGSGIKGVLRQAARELAGASEQAQWNIESDWSGGAIEALFGKEDSNNARRGALSFWDVIPQIKGNSLQVEVMTAHQSDYYQKGKSPHESGQPIPINFLTVPPGSVFTFHVVCDRPFLTRVAPDLAKDDRWRALLQKAFEHAFDWLGFGAKTAVGYGAMALDESAAGDREQVKAEAEWANLSPEEQAIEMLRKIFVSEREKGTLAANSQTAELRMKLLREALAWDEPELRAKAADQIQSTVKILPWSKKAKKQGIAQQLGSLKQGQ